MTLERRLREELEAEAARLDEPTQRLRRVVQRGRRRRFVQNATLGLTAIAVVLGAGAGLRAINTTRVAFDPAASPSATTEPVPPTPSPSSTPEVGPTAQPSEELPVVGIADLDAPVLAYRGGGRGITVHRNGEEQLLWSGKVDAAVPHAGGVVVQSQRRLLWFPNLDAPTPAVIAVAQTHLNLRGVLPDGRALYATIREGDDPEEMREHFFAVHLRENAEPEPVATEHAHESWTIGPAATAEQDLVMAQCHMMCSLWSWPAEAGATRQPLYHGGGSQQGPLAGIEAMDSTPDGTVIALAEQSPREGAGAPQIVLLDGATLRPITQIPLPIMGTAANAFTISVSSGGQRVLVSLHPYAAGPEGSAGVSLPSEAFVVDDALTATPRMSRLDFTGRLLWLDPQTGG